MIGMFNVAEGSGQAFVNRVLLLTNWRFPLDEMLADVKLCPYKVYEKGNVMAVVPSSAWLPVSVVPGTIVPVPTVNM